MHLYRVHFKGFFPKKIYGETVVYRLLEVCKLLTLNSGTFQPNQKVPRHFTPRHFAPNFAIFFHSCFFHSFCNICVCFSLQSFEPYGLVSVIPLSLSKKSNEKRWHYVDHKIFGVNCCDYSFERHYCVIVSRVNKK